LFVGRAGAARQTIDGSVLVKTVVEAAVAA